MEIHGMNFRNPLLALYNLCAVDSPVIIKKNIQTRMKRTAGNNINKATDLKLFLIICVWRPTYFIFLSEI